MTPILLLANFCTCPQGIGLLMWRYMKTTKIKVWVSFDSTDIIKLVSNMFCSLPVYCQTFFKAIASAKASESAAAAAPIWTIYYHLLRIVYCFVAWFLVISCLLFTFFLSAWEESGLVKDCALCNHRHIYIYYIYNARIFRASQGLCSTAPRLCNPTCIFIIRQSLSPFLFRTFVWPCCSCDNVCHSLATCASMRRGFSSIRAPPRPNSKRMLSRNRAPTLHRLSLQACAVRKAERLLMPFAIDCDWL